MSEACSVQVVGQRRLRRRGAVGELEALRLRSQIFTPLHPPSVHLPPSPCAAIPSLPCSDESLTIGLKLLLEPDLRLRFPSRRLYREWQRGLRLLLDLLLAPEDLLQPSLRSSPTAAAAAAGQLDRCSGASAASRPSTAGGSGDSGDRGGSRSTTSLCREVVLQILPKSARGSETAAPAAVALQPPSSGGQGAAAAASPRPGGGSCGPGGHGVSSRELKLKLTCNTGRLCAQTGSEQQLQAASARSQAALASAMQQRQQLGDGKPAPQQEHVQQTDCSGGNAAAALGGGGAPQLRRATIQLVASSTSLRELTVKTCSSEGAVELHPGGQECRLRRQGSRHQEQPTPRGSSARGAGRLRSGLRRAITLPARFLRASGAVAAAGMAPAAAGPAAAAANGSPSRQPLKSAMQPSSSTGDLANAAATEQHRLGAPSHERRLTLEGWADGRPASPASATPPRSSPQQQAIHNPTVQFSPGTLSFGGGSGQTSPLKSPHGRRRSPACSRPGQMPLPGPFIHLVGKAAWRLCYGVPVLACWQESSGHPPQRPPHPLPTAPHWPCAAAFTGHHAMAPSTISSGASTPQHQSAAGSPLRGSPNRRHQLLSFQRYLQQQTLQQQHGRYGPSVGDIGSIPGSVSSQHGSPMRQGSDASAPSPQSPSTGSPSGLAREGSAPPSSAGLPPVHPAAQHRLGTPGWRAATQLHFAARLQGAGGADAETPGGACRSPRQQAAVSWYDVGGYDGGSAPVSSRLPSWTGGSIGPLVRAESTFSSWGLPSPSTGACEVLEMLWVGGWVGLEPPT